MNGPCNQSSLLFYYGGNLSVFQELMVSLPVSTACKELELLMKFEHNLVDDIKLHSITIQIILKVL